MQYPQTRYVDSLAIGMTDTQLTLVCALVPPTRTQGILTIGRRQTNTEDVFYTNVAGNTVTISLRGLSTTALTPTTLLANEKTHNANESLEMTTHHNYDTDLLRKTETDTVTGAITFTNSADIFTNGVRIPAILDINGVISTTFPAQAAAVNNLRIQNSIAGSPVTIVTEGADPNVSLVVGAKGATGVVILEDKARMASAAFPVNPEDIVNKAYADSFAALSATLLTAKGALITATAASTPATLSVGANGTALTANSGTATGLEWVNPMLIATGTDSWNVSANGQTKVITHSLGKTPKYIEIIAYSAGNSLQCSMGSYTPGNGNIGLTINLTNVQVQETSGTGTTTIIDAGRAATTVGQSWTATITATSTTTFTMTSANYAFTFNVAFLWKVWA